MKTFQMRRKTSNEEASVSLILILRFDLRWIIAQSFLEDRKLFVLLLKRCVGIFDLCIFILTRKEKRLTQKKRPSKKKHANCTNANNS